MEKGQDLVIPPPVLGPALAPGQAVPVPLQRDPLLTRPNACILGFFDVFVDDFLSAAQGSTHRLQQVRRILMTAIDNVLRPLDSMDSPFRKEPISVKKLRQGDITWDMVKKVLGWVIESVAMTITLPERRLQRLADILADIPRSQKRVSVKK